VISCLDLDLKTHPYKDGFLNLNLNN